MMSDVGIIEAWRLWFSGQVSSDTTIWGISLIWWGRIGKLLQFVGATTIVAEIIGVERIRNFGKSLHDIGKPKRLKIWYFITAVVALYPTHLFASFLAKNLRPADPEKFAKLVGDPYWFNFVIFYVFDVLVLCLIPAYLFVSLDFIIFRPTAWALERPYIDKWVKLTALVLLIVGFHFDLLAS